MMKYLGLIFDCDGTLVDSMPPHFDAWQDVCQKYDLPFTETEFYNWGGWPTLKVARYLIERSGSKCDPVEISEEKEQGFVARLHTVQTIPQVIEIVEAWYGKIPMAVATGGTRDICEPMLRSHGLFDRFETIVTADDIVSPKPAPDTYLEAARRLKLAPETCCAYEDTEPGLDSARAANMDVIDVRLLRAKSK